MYNKNVSLCVHSKSHFLDPFLSIRSNIWKMGPWVYAQTPIENMLKDPHFSYVWVYAQRPIFHMFEHMLKDPFFIYLSISSRTHFSYVWANAQGPILLTTQYFLFLLFHSKKSCHPLWYISIKYKISWSVDLTTSYITDWNNELQRVSFLIFDWFNNDI